MTDEGGTDAPRDIDSGDAEAAVRTGIRDQWLVVSGWGASHADTGTPGPHLHVSTNDGRDPVLRTSQLPDFVDALQTVARRIDRMWEEDGETWFTGEEPDDNDPAVIRQKKIQDLEFLDRLQAHFTEVAAILLRSEDPHEAAAVIAPLLAVDEVDVEWRLGKLSLFGLTRGASRTRAMTLDALRGPS